ncbi:phospholipase D-like domain-containing protein [Derxia gummosa]|uniref:Phospholipase D-like domain-containing protein n=1 Tax=Derxia gummosa DSM 723 TaxID=1121388 RepID=A0A8B6XBH2_9BURK|nr:phospholipase D-like domain-containing protein [Derxia gummosa]
MNTSFNTKQTKEEKLIHMLMKGVDKRYFHTLYLTSCYFSTESAISLMRKMEKLAKLKKVFLFIDRKSAQTIEQKQFNRIRSCIRNVDVEILAVDTSTLFHSKGYAIKSDDKNGGVYRGSLAIGSANLTHTGLTENKNGNIEKPTRHARRRRGSRIP